MSGRHTLTCCRRTMALPRNVIALFCLFCFFVSGCEVFSPSFPKGFVRIASKLDAWGNQHEGFWLVLVSNDDRVQGFLEWEAQGLYGRIVKAEAKGSVRTLSLGDGGMDGLELTAEMQGASIEVRYVPRAQTEVKSGGVQEEIKVRATRLQAAKGLQVLAARYAIQEGSRSMSLRLQYLGAAEKSQRRVFDEALRRGKSPYQRAAFVRAQQEVASFQEYQQSSGQSGRPISPLEYEEIQYPVFISENVVSVATQHYLFNGGAHGAASTSFDVIDRRTGKRLGVGDIFAGKDWKTSLAPLLKAELLRQHGFQNAQQKDSPDTGLAGERAAEEAADRRRIDLKALGFFEPDILPSENVFICGRGIGFEYDRYQIAPWYMGEFIVVLPWSELKPYLSAGLLSAGLFR